jgi:lysophospholipase L1-like esterase
MCSLLVLGCGSDGGGDDGPQGGAGAPAAQDTTLHTVEADDPNVRLSGRFDRRDPKAPRTSAPAASMTLRFRGVSVSALLADQFLYGKKNYYAAFVDGGDPIRIVPNVDNETNKYPIASDLAYGEHTVSVVKKTESGIGTGRFLGFEIGGVAAPLPEKPSRRIEIIGDSISAGAGNEVRDGSELCGDAHWGEANDASRSYGVLLGQSLNAEVHVSAVSGRGLVRNYSMRYDTRPIPEVYDLVYMEQTSSIAWDTTLFVPDAVLVALGTNDFSPGDSTEPAREKMTPEVFSEAYIAFVERLRGDYPDAHIFLLSSPMLGDGWPDATYRSATDHKASLTAVEAHFQDAGDAKVTRFFVTKLPGAGCGTHPDLAQHAAMAAELEPVLKEALNW